MYTRLYAFPALYKLRIRSEPALAARPSTIHQIKDKYKYPLSTSVSLGKEALGYNMAAETD